MFSKKKIKVEVTLYNDDSFLSGSVLTFEDLPVSVEIIKTRFPAEPRASIRVYGVSKEKMEAITTVAWKTGVIDKKKVRLEVDDGNGYQLLFEGGIRSAVPVYDSAPDVYIQIESSMVAFPNMMKVPPFVSFGESTIFNVVNGICNQYGSRAINVGVDGVCGSQYFDQFGFKNRLNAVCEAFDLFVVEDVSGVFVYPKNGFSAKTYVLTKEHRIGYPSFGYALIKVKVGTLFDIRVGDTFKIDDSEIVFANDKWICGQITYSLQTLSNSGKWQMELTGYRIEGV